MNPASGSIPPHRVELLALADVPAVRPGDDLPAIVAAAVAAAGLSLQRDDVVCVASKLVSRAEGRHVMLADVQPGERAHALDQQVGRPPELVELVLRESTDVSRAAPGVLIVRSRLGHVSANAGIDLSNTGAPAGDDVALLLPVDPDASASAIRAALGTPHDAPGVIITDSFGRPFRVGTVGAAIGLAGVSPLADYRGHYDLDGRELRVTVAGLADQIATAADMVAGQGAEGRGVVVVRGMICAGDGVAADLLRDPATDLYA